MSSTINILMTGGGALGAAGILKCLQQEKSFQITVADANPNAVGKFLNKAPIGIGFETIPFANDDTFIDSVLSLCRKKKYSCHPPFSNKRAVATFATCQKA